MNKKWLSLYVFLICTTLIISGCGYQENKSRTYDSQGKSKVISYNSSGISTKLESYINHNGSQKSKALILGDTVIIGKTDNNQGNMNRISNDIAGVKGTNFQNNPSTIQNLVGERTRVLYVTDQQVLKAIDRVKSALNTNAQSPTLATDLELILSKAK